VEHSGTSDSRSSNVSHCCTISSIVAKSQILTNDICKFTATNPTAPSSLLTYEQSTLQCTSQRLSKLGLEIRHTSKIHGADASQVAQHFRLLHLYTSANCFVRTSFDEAPTVDAIRQIPDAA